MLAEAVADRQDTERVRPSELTADQPGRHAIAAVGTQASGRLEDERRTIVIALPLVQGILTRAATST